MVFAAFLALFLVWIALHGEVGTYLKFAGIAV